MVGGEVGGFRVIGWKLEGIRNRLESARASAYMRFSQRAGIVSAKKPIQVESIDSDLRNSLWSLLTTFYWETFSRRKWEMYERADYILGSNLENLFTALWFDYFKKPTDTIPKYYYDEDDGLGVIRRYFFGAKWYEVYDFIEFVRAHGPSLSRDKFTIACNKILERENSGYRFVDGRIAEITSLDEVKEIETAMEKAVPYYGVKEHLATAISFLSNKTKPDYRNSIKESISAVEALCKKISNEESASLGAALKALESRVAVHPALKAAFSALYGYSSDANGIRHALMEKSTLTSADARFMLISCSAFINYVIASTTQDS